MLVVALAFALTTPAPACVGLACYDACMTKGDASACAAWGDLVWHARAGGGGHVLAAAPFWEKACAAGVAQSCERLAYAYATGEGLPKRPDLGAALIAPRCEQGDFHACRSLLDDVFATEPAAKAAEKRLEVVCRRGDAESCSALEDHGNAVGAHELASVSARVCRGEKAPPGWTWPPYVACSALLARPEAAKPEVHARLLERAVELGSTACAHGDHDACGLVRSEAAEDARLQAKGCRLGARVLCDDLERGRCKDLDLDACTRLLAAKHGTADVKVAADACVRSSGQRWAALCLAAGESAAACKRGSQQGCTQAAVDGCNAGDGDACLEAAKAKTKADLRPALRDMCSRSFTPRVVLCGLLADLEEAHGAPVHAAYARAAACRKETPCRAKVKAPTLEQARYGCELNDGGACLEVFHRRGKGGVSADEARKAIESACYADVEGACRQAAVADLASDNTDAAVGAYKYACFGHEPDLAACRDLAALYCEGRYVPKHLGMCQDYEQVACKGGDGAACAAVERLRR